MLRMAKLYSIKQQHTSYYVRGNGEKTLFPDETFDIVTIMYAFHECPKFGRTKILREARRLLKKDGRMVIVDISPCYEPSPQMLSGEPYVLEFQKNIQKQIKTIRGLKEELYSIIIPKHVAMWILKRE